MASPTPRPLHLRVVGTLALLWNGFGAFDYLMTQTGNEAYLSQFTPEQLEYFTTFPIWVDSFWALAVWGGLLGALLLLLAKRLAVPVFLVSLLSMCVTFVHNFFLSEGIEVMGTGGAAFSGVILGVAVGLWIYARLMADQELLS